MNKTTNSHNNHMGYKIKRVREIIGVKQNDLAERLQISQQSVSKLENKKNIESATLENVAEALEIPTGAIKNFTDEEALNILRNALMGNLSDRGSSLNNPIERITMLYDEKIELYERMLKAKQDEVTLLEKLLRKK